MRANRPSATARLIARCTLLASHESSLRRLVPDDAVAPLERMLAATGGHAWFDGVVRRAAPRRLLLGLERAILPGIIVHYLARKRWLEQQVLAAIGDGCRQVVVLGAGFDTLAWRWHRRQR